MIEGPGYSLVAVRGEADASSARHAMSTSATVAAAELWLLAEDARGYSGTFVPGGNYARDAARNLDLAAAHLRAGRHDDAARHLGTARRRMVLSSLQPLRRRGQSTPMTCTNLARPGPPGRREPVRTRP
jgi:hypothetical protein